MPFGNKDSYLRLRELLSGSGSGRTVLIKGPPHSGKATALAEACSEVVGPDDSFFPDHGVDSAREAVSFARYAPQSGPLRAVCVTDADRLTDSARDAYLKLSEETPPGCCVVLTSSDPGGMPPALRSRVRDVIEWRPLSDPEIAAFASEVGTPDPGAVAMSCGLPGMYSRLAHQPRYADLAAAVRGVASGSRGVLDEPPQVILKLDAKSDDRPAVAHVMRLVARSIPDPAVRSAVLEFVMTVSSQPSANSEIHWFRMVARSRASTAV